MHIISNLILSTGSSETLGGLTFRDGDLVEYDPDMDLSTLFFNEDLFTASENIDALYVLSNDNIVLSTTGSATLGGLSFTSGDLVEYNPLTDTGVLLFDGNLFSGNENVDAVFIQNNGNIILSTAGSATLGGLSFGNDDLVEYDPLSDTSSLFFDGSLFSGSENIDAFDLLSNGNILLSTTTTATLGGLTFSNGSLAEYNPLTGIASLYFDENLFSNAANIDAVFITSVPVPEPATAAILAFGGLMMVHKMRHK